MDVGARLLHALCVEGDSYGLYRAKVTEDYFVGDELAVYEWLKDYSLKHGNLPQPATLMEHFPGLPKAPEPSGFYLEQVENRYRHRTLNRGLVECSDLMKDKLYDKVTARMAKALGDVYMVDVRQQMAEFTEDAWELVKEAYTKAQIPGNGIKFGWEYLDDMTAGLFPGDVVSYVGRPAMGKTYLQLYSAHQMWWVQHKNVMFFSMEMPILALVQRIAAIHTGITVTDIKQGTLPKFPVNMEVKLAQKMLSVKDHGSKLWIFDGNLAATPQDIYGIAAQLKPDVVFIDGAYLLRHENPKMDRYVRVAENVESIKALTGRQRVPTICTYQFKREAAKKGKKATTSEIPQLEDIAYSDAIGQTSSVVLGLFQEETVETLKTRSIAILKGREGETGQFQVNWNFAKMDFGQYKEPTMEEVGDSTLDYI